MLLAALAGAESNYFMSEEYRQLQFNPGQWLDYDLDNMHVQHEAHYPEYHAQDHWNTVKYSHHGENLAIPSLGSMKKVFDAGSEAMGPIAEIGGMAMTTVDKFTKEGPRSCWLKTKGRGFGHPLSACPKDKEKNLLMCYDKCKEGYTGVGPVCWQDCPKDFPYLLGPTCKKPAPYGRGVGSFWKGKDDEKWGLLWYPKCKDGFYAFACCICSPKCPEGMADIGVVCTKKSYGRGIGSFLICPEPYE